MFLCYAGARDFSDHRRNPLPMKSRTIPAAQDPATTWKLIACTVIELISKNIGQLGVPDIVSAVAQYAHFSSKPGASQEAFAYWLRQRLDSDEPFIIYARIPGQHKPVAADCRRSLMVGGQEHPWPAFSIDVWGASIRVQLLDERVQARYDAFCDMLIHCVGGLSAQESVGGCRPR